MLPVEEKLPFPHFPSGLPSCSPGAPRVDAKWWASQREPLTRKKHLVPRLPGQQRDFSHLPWLPKHMGTGREETTGAWHVLLQTRSQWKSITLLVFCGLLRCPQFSEANAYNPDWKTEEMDSSGSLVVGLSLSGGIAWSWCPCPVYSDRQSSAWPHWESWHTTL